MLNFIRALCAVFFFARLFALTPSAAQDKDDKSGKVGGFNFLPALFVVCIFAILTACGGGGGTAASPMTTPMTMTTANPQPAITPQQVAAIRQQVGDGVTREELFRILLENNIAQRDFFEQYLRDLGLIARETEAPQVRISIIATNPQMPVTVRVTSRITVTAVLPQPTTPPFITMTPPPTPPPPMTMTILPPMTMTTTTPVTMAPPPTTLRLTNVMTTTISQPPWILSVTATMCIPGCGPGGTLTTFSTMAVTIAQPLIMVTTTITSFSTSTLAQHHSELSFSPQISRVVDSAMADSFNRGIAIGDSGFAFSGRYDGDNRAAGFSYDYGSFAMRTDYIRLPSKQDSAVWLDTYRFGVMPVINDDMRLFAGVDNYNNAILVIDKQGGGLWHRFGAAMGEGNNGYAVKYELRLNL